MCGSLPADAHLGSPIYSFGCLENCVLANSARRRDHERRRLRAMPLTRRIPAWNLPTGPIGPHASNAKVAHESRLSTETMWLHATYVFGKSLGGKQETYDPHR